MTQSSLGSSEDDCAEHSTTSALIQSTSSDKNEMRKQHKECIISKGTLNELQCKAYKYSWWKIVLSLLGVLCSGGFLVLIFYWRPDWLLFCTCSPATWSDVTHVLLATSDGTDQVFVSKIESMSVELASLVRRRYPNQSNNINTTRYDGGETVGSVMWFEHHLSKFIWHHKEHTFIELVGLSGQATLGQLHRDGGHGLEGEEIETRASLFGPNLIKVKIPSYHQLLVSEILNPFYVFQLFACIFWMFDEYYVYATSILIVSIISAIASLIEVRRERVRLHDMVEYHNTIKVEVLRMVDGQLKQIEVWSKDLVPGDVLIIPPGGAQLPCDAALISGTCIVNESMLTGESIPVTKTPLPSGSSELPHLYEPDLHKRHSLFCGTQVLQTRFYRGELVKAVVVETGFHTAKGSLVHSILFPKPVDLRLLRDAYRFIGILFIMAMCGFIYTVVLMHFRGETARDIAFNAIDLITISVPPALPLALTIGIIYAQLRLKKQKIHCISPQRINISGQVDVVAFDKTGTLTEDGLDMYSVIPVNHNATSHGAGGQKFMTPVQPDQLGEDLGVESEVVRCMVTCHTLTTIDGRLSGDPLDVKMFEATGWRMIEPTVEDELKYDQLQSTYFRPPSALLARLHPTQDPGGTTQSFDTADNQEAEGNMRSESSHDVGVVRQFPFSSALQRASVIVKPYQSGPKDLLIFLKGAPETVAKLCQPNSLPNDFYDVLKSYTQQGLRMIGLAYKPLACTWLKAQKLERHAAESQLVFLGLIALENKLKPQSAKSLKKLREAGIRTLMVTGDNLLTSLSVARESGLVHPSDVVLLASTTPPTPSTPATLSWGTSEDVPGSSPSSLTSSFSSTEEKMSRKDRTVSMCMGEQIPSNWHLAVSGSNFAIIREYFPEWTEVLATKGVVFARMSPAQKTSLIEDLQEIDYHVCMCGDGANDCGALKRAHAGLSLSEHEASVAAPFTSHTDMGIECVPTLIREGRAALVTSFGVFKFMALYSVIQFCTVTILYNKRSNLGDLQYLYIDLIVIDLIALTMTRNHAHKILDRRRPPTSLVSLEMLVSLIFHIIFQCAVQVLVFILVQEQCWYTEETPVQVKNMTYGNNVTCPELNNVPDQSHIEDEDNILTYMDSALFLFSALLYISVSVAFSRGRPFRTPIYKNFLFMGSLLILVLFTLFLIFFAPQSLYDFIEVRTIPDVYFNLLMVGIAAGHLIVSVMFEMLVVEQVAIWECVRRSCRRRVSKRYKTILRHFASTSNGHISMDHVIESGQSEVPNPVAVLNKPMLSTIPAEGLLLANKTRL